MAIGYLWNCLALLCFKAALGSSKTWWTSTIYDFRPNLQKKIDFFVVDNLDIVFYNLGVFFFENLDIIFENLDIIFENWI